MTAQNLALKHPYTSNGSQVVYDYDNYIWDKTHLRLAVFNASGVAQPDLVVDTDYTVQNVGVAGGGTVTLATALPSGWKLVILYSYPVEQTFDLTNTIRVFTADHETALDKIVYGMLTLKEQLARAVLVPEDGSVTSTEYLQDVQANRTAAEAAQALAEAARDDAEAAWASISPFATAIATVASIQAAVTTVAGISANVTTVAGVAANVTTVAGSIANVNTTAAAIANVNTVATNIANVNTVAGISANVTTVAGVAANVTTVATNIANVNTVANNMASVINAANNIPKANLSATVDPTVGNDNTQSYQPGSLWVNTSTGNVFICTSAATGAAAWGNVGAYNAAAINASGTFQMTGTISPATLTGTTQHDYAPTGFATANVVRLTASSATSITGFGNPSAGRVIMLVCATTSAITLNNQNAGSVAANQIICPGGVDFVLPNSANVFIAYDSSVSRWRVVSPAPVSAATTSAAGTVRLGTSAEIQSESPAGNVVAPITGVRNNPGVAKGWVNFNTAGTVQQSFGNYSSITKTANGNFTVNLSPSMATTTYVVEATVNMNAGCTMVPKVFSKTASSFVVQIGGTCDSGYGLFDSSVDAVWFGTW